MIGHFLGTLTRLEEDRVLMRKMAPGSYFADHGVGACLVGTVCDVGENGDYRLKPNTAWHNRHGKHYDSVETNYDWACVRFGSKRVNAAIRTRILANRAWRILHGERKNVTSVACDVGQPA